MSKKKLCFGPQDILWMGVFVQAIESGALSIGPGSSSIEMASDCDVEMSFLVPLIDKFRSIVSAFSEEADRIADDRNSIAYKEFCKSLCEMGMRCEEK